MKKFKKCKITDKSPSLVTRSRVNEPRGTQKIRTKHTKTRPISYGHFPSTEVLTMLEKAYT